MTDSLLPRVALVTDGAGRRGRPISQALASAGFAVAVHCRGDDRHEAEALAGEIAGSGGQAAALAADLTDEASAARLVSEAGEALGRVGVLVNNASVLQPEHGESASRASWNHHLEPNLRAPFVLTQRLAAALPAAAKGLVINMVEHRPCSATLPVSYALSKMGLWTLTQQMALALAPRVRVNAISPGQPAPGKRLGEDIARAVLAIIALPSMTGQLIALDGTPSTPFRAAGTEGAD